MVTSSQEIYSNAVRHWQGRTSESCLEPVNKLIGEILHSLKKSFSLFLFFKFLESVSRTGFYTREKHNTTANNV